MVARIDPENKSEILCTRKKHIGYENCYRNNSNSTFLARARTNTLRLEEHKGRGVPGYNKTCKLCNDGEENIVHFIIDCKELEDTRNYSLIDNNLRDSEEKKITLLFYNENFQDIGYMLKKLWWKRRNLLDYYKYYEKQKNLDSKRNKENEPQRRIQNSDPGPMKRGCAYQRQRLRNLSVGRG